MIAAGIIAKHEIVNAIIEKSNIRLPASHKTETLTADQVAAWENLVRSLGPDFRRLEWPSATEIAQAALQAMQDQASNLLLNQSVKKAHDQLILVSKLAVQLTN
jgi:hypothetical protein